MRLKTFFLFCLISCVMLVSANQPNERRRGAADAAQTILPDGIVYALPRTVIVVKVKAQREVFLPGPYAAYAQKYLGYTQVEMQERILWNITNIDVELEGEPDPLAMYKAMDSVASRIALLPDGRLAGINLKSEPLAFHPVKRNQIVLPSIPRIPFPDLSSNDEYEVQVDATRGTERLVPKSLDIKAQEAADYLFRLRKKRAYTILSSSDIVPEDGLGYKVFLEETRRIEKEYVELFLGKAFVSEHEFVFEYVPGEKEVKNDVLFRFSEEKGVLPKSDLSGKPVVIDLTRDNKIVSKIQELKNPTNPIETYASGIYYRIPLMSELSIANGLVPLFSARVPVAQFGAVAPVPENLLDGKSEVLFNHFTGSIERVMRK